MRSAGPGTLASEGGEKFAIHGENLDVAVTGVEHIDTVFRPHGQVSGRGEHLFCWQVEPAEAVFVLDLGAGGVLASDRPDHEGGC